MCWGDSGRENKFPALVLPPAGTGYRAGYKICFKRWLVVRRVLWAHPPMVIGLQVEESGKHLLLVLGGEVDVAMPIHPSPQ